MAFASCDGGETLLELRIDFLSDPAKAPRIVDRVLARRPGVSLVATCRRTGNGGHFAGSIDEQLDLLRRAAEAGARVVDVEIETVERAPAALGSLGGLATTLVSFHDFQGTPDLQPVVERLARTGADVLKVATRVVRPTDNLRLLALCQEHPNMVVAGMGETGAPARLYSPARGGRFAYVAPDRLGPSEVAIQGIEVSPTAPGQMEASVARRLYRVHEASAGTPIYAVIAKPVGHSKSPLIHNRAFRSVGYDGMYVPLLVEPGDVGDFFHLMRKLPLSGVSVTIPHKQSVIEHLDEIDPVAEGIGAVNTLYWKDGRLAGTNTDAIGISAPLSRRLNLRGSRSLVVGNGGAAKAAIVALQQGGATVTVTGRDPARVARLAESHGVEAVAFDLLDDRYFDVLIQATPVGMLPDVEGNLFPRRIPADVVFDLVYNPLETALLKQAAAAGKVAISGIEMFVEQAAAQFRIWTGLEAPRAVMREAVLGRTLN